MTEHINFTHGGGAMKTIVASCAVPTQVHQCARGHAAALRERAALVVIHTARNGTAIVQVHLYPSQRQLTKLGEHAVLNLMERWHHTNRYSAIAVPKMYMDPLRLRWVGLSAALLDPVIADIQAFLGEAGNFTPIVIPRAEAL